MDKAPNYPNSQNVSPQGMQRCLAWYPQQFRALRTPGLTGLKASLGWAPGEVSTWPHNTMLDYGPLERKQAQGNGQNKSGARTTKRPWNYFKGSRNLEDVQAPFFPPAPSGDSNTICGLNSHRGSPSLSLLSLGFLLQIGGWRNSQGVLALTFQATGHKKIRV